MRGVAPDGKHSFGSASKSIDWAEELPDELQRSILHKLSAVGLAQASAVCAKLKGFACEVAERRLRQSLPHLPPGADATPCWLRSLGFRELVGARPATTWRDEFVDAMVECATIDHQRDPDSPLPLERSEYGPDGELGLEQASKTFLASYVGRRVAAGWTEEEALLYKCTTTTLDALAHERFPATVHAHIELYSEMARRTAAVPEQLYCKLLGGSGLAHCDPSWSPAALLTLGVGGSFVSKVMLSGFRGILHLSNAEGWEEPVDDEHPEQTHVLPSDVVCFRSAPKDAAGFHALIHGQWPDASRRVTRSTAFGEDEDHWGAPLFTRVTLERVQHAGEWRGYEGGPLMKVRLFTVSFSFG